MYMEHKIFPQITKVIMSKMHSAGGIVMLGFKSHYTAMVTRTQGTSAQTDANPWNKVADLYINLHRLSTLSQSKYLLSRKQRTANASKTVRKNHPYSLEIIMEAPEKGKTTWKTEISYIFLSYTNPGKVLKIILVSISQRYVYIHNYYYDAHSSQNMESA